jgi:hypothetical protein
MLYVAGENLAALLAGQSHTTFGGIEEFADQSVAEYRLGQG